MPTKMLVFIRILLVIKFPIITPIKGIMKWYTPTINDNNSLSFFVIPCVPYISANEKASIDRLIAIKNNEVVIPDSAIRLRVIPNSNTSVDQNIKNKVKKYLEENTYTLLEEVSDLKEARTLINANIENLDNDIGNIFKENNYDMSYKINFGYNYFPAKEYRNIKYKEGYYESIVITIGNGEGNNWWCFLFPNLCLVDLQNKTDIEYKSWLIKQINKIF